MVSSPTLFWPAASAAFSASAAALARATSSASFIFSLCARMGSSRLLTQSRLASRTAL
jgi:hypothetical protein